MRLGVASALVDGGLVTGDVEFDRGTGRIVAVGLAGTGRGTAVAGLVDLQVNGVGAVDLRDAEPDAIDTACVELAAGGTTAFCPTLHSAPVPRYLDALGVLDAVRRRGEERDPVGARLLGAHLEGPFLAPSRRGAHDPAHLLEPDADLLGELCDAGQVALVTLAPELPGALELVRALAARGVVAAVGHTDATAAQVRAGVDDGAQLLTHCWNAHRPLSARDPGPAGAALTDERLTLGVIGDLVHVAAEVLLFSLAAAPGRVAVSTDRVVDGAQQRRDGGLAGGVATSADCLGHLVGLGVGLDVAVDACGGAQRRLLGLEEVRLRPGDPADVVVLDDELSPQHTLVAGHEVWRGPS